jgi:1-acyl-sn-glycerol-3-phosphate acyltransferase
MTRPPPRRTPGRLLLDGVAHVLMLLLTAGVIASLQIAGIVAVPFRKAPWAPGAAHRSFRFVLRTFIGIAGLAGILQVRTEGKPLSGPTVFVANHPSLIDALLLLPHLPETVCLYKVSLHKTFLPKPIAETAGFISNAGGMESVREATERLGRGLRVLLFPEGTRTTIPPMGPWKSSYALIATRAGVPVQPIYIRMPSPVFPKGGRWWVPPAYPVRATLHFGLAIPPPQAHSAREFHRETEAAFRDRLTVE